MAAKKRRDSGVAHWVQRYRNGESCGVIADEADVPVRVVSDALRAAGLEIRRGRRPATLQPPKPPKRTKSPRPLGRNSQPRPTTTRGLGWVASLLRDAAAILDRAEEE